jgi:hypothetical protein
MKNANYSNHIVINEKHNPNVLDENIHLFNHISIVRRRRIEMKTKTNPITSELSSKMIKTRHSILIAILRRRRIEMKNKHYSILISIVILISILRRRRIEMKNATIQITS